MVDQQARFAGQPGCTGSRSIRISGSCGGMLVFVASKAVRVFCAYAPDDADLGKRFEAHLALLRREGYITVWYAQALAAGIEKDRSISEHLESARLILLLISASFMGSDECYDMMRRALELQRTSDVRVVPVLLRPVDWKPAPFAHLQVLPRNEQPISEWESNDQAFYHVVQELHSIVESLRLPVSFLSGTDSGRSWFVPYRRNPYYTGQGKPAGASTRIAQAAARRCPGSVWAWWYWQDTAGCGLYIVMLSKAATGMESATTRRFRRDLHFNCCTCRTRGTDSGG
jgi:hypothetical protein